MHSQNASSEVKADQSKSQSAGAVSVGKDNDGLITSMSLATSLSIPDNAKKIVNSKEDEGREEMIAASVDLMMHFYQKSPERLKNLNCAELNQLSFNGQEMNRSVLRETMRACVVNNFNIDNFGTGRAYDCYLAFKLNTPRHTSEPLSPQWEAVSKKYHVSKEFAATYRDTVKEEGNLIGFRLDERSKTVVPPKRLSSKPGYIWLKGGKPALFLNKILEDQQHFGNPNEKGEIVPGVHTKVTANVDAYPQLIKRQTITYTLQELMHGVENGTYTIDKSLSSDDRLSFRMVPGVNNNPINQNYVFSLVMDQTSKKLLGEDIYNNISNNKESLEKLKDGTNVTWNSKWGTVEDALKQEFKLQSDVSGVGNNFADTIELVVPLDENPNAKYVFNPVQHSFECYNPGIQSNLNSLALFVSAADGQPIVQQDFKGTTNYLANNGAGQVMHINSHWDMSMDRSGRLVEAQIHLVDKNIKQGVNGVPIEPSTLNAFVKSLDNGKKPIVGEASFDALINVANHLEKDGAGVRIQICHYLAKQMQESGTVPCKRTVLNELMSTLKKDASITKEQPNPAAEALASLTASASQRREQQKTHREQPLRVNEESEDVGAKTAPSPRIGR